MPDSDSPKPNEPGGTKYIPPAAVRVSKIRLGRPALSPQFQRLECKYDVRRSRGDHKQSLWLH
jgi:hypothetical protein